MYISNSDFISANTDLPLRFYTLVNADLTEYLTDRDIESMYIDMLDEVYPDLEIAGYPYLTSRALKDVDPIAYNCGLQDFLSSLLADGEWFEIELEDHQKHVSILEHEEMKKNGYIKKQKKQKKTK